MCGVPFHAADGYITRLVKLGLPRGHLRADRGSQEGQGRRQARRRARRHPRHADRCRRTSTPVSRPSCWRRPGSTRRPARTCAWAWRCSISPPASSRPPSISGPAARQALDDEIAVLRPREIVVAAGCRRRPVSCRRRRPPGSPSRPSTAGRSTRRAPPPRSATSCGWRACRVSDSTTRPAAAAAAGALVHYLRETQKADLAHVRTIRLRETADRLLVDPTTLQHLEVVESSRGGRSGSLLDEVDRTVTPMGGRLLRAWLIAPLVSLERIRDRLDAVEELAFRATDRGKVRDTLRAVLRPRAAGVAGGACRQPAPAISWRSPARWPPCHGPSAARRTARLRS